MVSSIRIRDEDKEILDSLINYFNIKTNKKITREELVALLIKTGSQNMDKLVSEIKPVSEEVCDWQSDPIFTIKNVHAGKNASVSVDNDIYIR